MPPPEDDGTATSEPANGVEQPKFTRYRSQRGRTVPKAPLPSDAQQVTSDDGDASGGAADRTETQQNQSHVESASEKSIARSMSRYRNRRPSQASVSSNANANDATPKVTSDAQPTPDVPPIPSTLKSPQQPDEIPTEKEQDAPDANSNVTVSSPTRQQPRQTQPDPSQPEPEMTDFEYRYDVASSIKDDSSQLLEQQREDALRQAREIAQMDAVTERLLAEQKNNDPGRLQIHPQLANSHEPVGRFSKPRSPVLEKFVNFTIGRKSKEPSPALSPASSTTGSMDNNYAFSELPKAPKGIMPGGKGVVPQTDAPISAVNAGDRIVSVSYREHTFPLPVTPETTLEDVIRSTMKAYDHGQMIEQMVVVESYGPLGLERKIRRFEHIRDIMNSWDGDGRNHLVVTESDSTDEAQSLELASVPDTKDPPPGDRFYMHYSNKPGKWSKRYITLMDSGQMLSSKKPETSGADKDTVKLCNLSDYDIYRPTPDHARRQLKPPKKYCFAVKSQHKSSMFLNTDNYVHYFCTEDAELASRFFEKVFGWRSWYLVDRRPAPQQITIPKIDEKPPQLPSATKPSSNASTAVNSTDGRPSEGFLDDNQYRLGEFEPLLDMGRFDKRLSQFGKDLVLPLPADVRPTTPKNPVHRKKDSQTQKPDGALVTDVAPASDAAFTGAGLLGGGYEERKAALAAGEEAKEAAKDSANGAFIEGPSLLNPHPEAPASPPQSPSWFPSALEHTAKHREAPTPKPQPKIHPPPARKPSISEGRSPGGKQRPGPPRFALHPSMKPNPQFPGNALAPQYNGSPHQPQPGQPPMPQQANPRPRPNDAPGPMSGSRSLESSPMNHRQPHKPLINLEPNLNEPPQWAKKGGRGIQPPEGLSHLVDLISVGTPKGGPSSRLEVPPRSMMRRGQEGMASNSNAHGTAPPMPRNRGPGHPGHAPTRSSPGMVPPMRHERPNTAPMPLAQGMPGTVAPLRVQRPPVAGPGQPHGEGLRRPPPPDSARPSSSQSRRREFPRDRDGPDYNAGSGRAGTLRAV